jgi:hypothetical protein
LQRYDRRRIAAERAVRERVKAIEGKLHRPPIRDRSKVPLSGCDFWTLAGD